MLVIPKTINKTYCIIEEKFENFKAATPKSIIEWAQFKPRKSNAVLKMAHYSTWLVHKDNIFYSLKSSQQSSITFYEKDRKLHPNRWKKSHPLTIWHIIGIDYFNLVFRRVDLEPFYMFIIKPFKCETLEMESCAIKRETCEFNQAPNIGPSSYTGPILKPQ